MGAVERIKSNPWQATPKLRYDSSDDDGDESDDDIELNDTVHTGINPSNSTSQLDELFFFHPDDPILANRINGEICMLLNVFGKGVGLLTYTSSWCIQYTCEAGVISTCCTCTLFALNVSQSLKMSFVHFYLTVIWQVLTIKPLIHGNSFQLRSFLLYYYHFFY